MGFNKDRRSLTPCQGFDGVALTRAITPEMNTVGLGGLQDKKGRGDFREQKWKEAGLGESNRQ